MTHAADTRLPGSTLSRGRETERWRDVQFHAHPQDEGNTSGANNVNLQRWRLARALGSMCFFGDSQMRNNLYWLFPGCEGFKFSVCAAVDGHFFFIKFAEDFLAAGMQEIWADAALCPVVVVNFGQ